METIVLKCIFIAGNLFIVSPDGQTVANLSMAQSVRVEGGHLVVAGVTETTEIPLPMDMPAERAIQQCDEGAMDAVMKLETF